MISLRVPRVVAMATLFGLLSAWAGCADPPPAPVPPPGAQATDRPDPASEDGTDGPIQGDGPALPGREAVEPDRPALSGAVLESMTAAELVRRARTTYDLDDRIRLLEVALKKAPDDPDVLHEITDSKEDKGLDLALNRRSREESKTYLDQAAEHARALLRVDDSPTGERRGIIALALYNEACNLVLAGQHDRAIESLRTAVELDFAHPDIFTDPELEPLRGREEFQELLDRVRRSSDGLEGGPVAPGGNGAD